MLPYRTIEAIQHERAARFTRERERAVARRKATKNEPGGLSELLDSLARGLASIGFAGRNGSGRPASPAY